CGGTRSTGSAVTNSSTTPPRRNCSTISSTASSTATPESAGCGTSGRVLRSVRRPAGPLEGALLGLRPDGAEALDPEARCWSWGDGGNALAGTYALWLCQDPRRRGFRVLAARKRGTGLLPTTSGTAGMVTDCGASASRARQPGAGLA